MLAQLGLALHYGLTILLSAFLLFQVQPIIAKLILPWFGGSASVWTACMLFFQMLLLLGYLYSHFVVRLLSARQQSLLHIALLGVSLLLLPISPSADWRPSGGEDPTPHILALLTVTIGLPYFVLSTTGPLIQAWFAREKPGAVPYRLFALSNFGSLLALLAYPVLVEPRLPTRWQSGLWSALFAVFALLCGLLAWRGRHGGPALAAVPAAVKATAPTLPLRLRWIALAACPSILLVADTSFLTANIAPIPLLWVLPLALYLLSFIFCFERRGWYRRGLFLPLLALGLGAMAYLPTLGVSALPIYLAMGINLAAFFAACMVCHGELARLHPHPSQLTGYFLMIAIGGALGGLFVGVVAPYCFSGNFELPIALVLTAGVASWVVLGSHRFASGRRQLLAWGAAAALMLGIAGVSLSEIVDDLDGARVTARNFYGTLRVLDGGEGLDARRSLMHGQIVHGRQFQAPERQDWPTAYYSQDSGVGRALLTKAAMASGGPLRIGVIGVGVGTLLTYGRPGDSFRLYEIDPLVMQLARSEFTFLSRSKATTEIVIADARLALERETAQQFDLLVVDAFSGDAVPIHLLTQEAFASYFRHLKPQGVLAVHVTNRFLDLKQVIKSAADHFGWQARLLSTASDGDRLVYHSDWVLVSADPRFFEQPALTEAAPIAVAADFRLWSDDYSSVLSVLK
nr:fused MFS/spermidine synthase [uncultured Roseateles sp.]